MGVILVSLANKVGIWDITLWCYEIDYSWPVGSRIINEFSNVLSNMIPFLVCLCYVSYHLYRVHTCVYLHHTPLWVYDIHPCGCMIIILACHHNCKADKAETPSWGWVSMSYRHTKFIIWLKNLKIKDLRKIKFYKLKFHI